jgi:hypothetical protein
MSRPSQLDLGHLRLWTEGKLSGSRQPDGNPQPESTFLIDLTCYVASKAEGGLRACATIAARGVILRSTHVL